LLFGQGRNFLDKSGLSKEQLKSTLNALPIKINGNILLDNRYAFRDSINTIMPPNYTRLWLNATVSVYEIPITFKTILTTEQNPQRQSMNSFSVGFNAFDWKQVIRAKMDTKIAQLKKDFTPKELASMQQYLELVEKLDVDSLQALGEAQLEKLKTQAKDSSEAALEKLKASGDKKARLQLEKTKQYREKTKKHEAKAAKLEKQRMKALSKKDSSVAKMAKVKDRYDQKDRILLERYQKWQEKSLEKLKSKKVHKQANKYGEQAKKIREKIPYKDAKELGFDPSLIYNEEKLKKYQELQDLEKMRESLDAKAVEKLREIGFISKLEKYAAGFKNFGIGMVYPDYSQYSLRGVPINGINLDYQWEDKWQIGLVGAQSQRTTLSVDSLSGQLKRIFIGGRFGYGKLDGNNIHINVLGVRDSENDISSADSGFYQSPKQNYVATIDFSYVLLKDKLKISGELGGAMYASNTRQAEIGSLELENSQSQMNSGVFSDVAFRVITSLKPDKKTHLELDFNRVGATYVSLGVPNLRNDIFHAGFRGQRSFLKNDVLVLRFNFQYEFDNLKDLKPSTTANQIYNIGMQYRFPKNISLSSTYTYVSQKNGKNMGLYAIDEVSHLLMNSLMLPHSLGGLKGSAIVTYLFQNTNSLQLGERMAHNAQLRETLTFPVPVTLSLMLGGSYIQPTNQQTVISELSGQWQAGKRLSLGMGVNYGAEIYLSDKTGVFVTVTYSPVKNMQINLRSDYNTYRHSIVEISSYQEGLFQCRMNYKF